MTSIISNEVNKNTLMRLVLQYEKEFGISISSKDSIEHFTNWLRNEIITHLCLIHPDNDNQSILSNNKSKIDTNNIDFNEVCFQAETALMPTKVIRNYSDLSEYMGRLEGYVVAYFEEKYGLML